MKCSICGARLKKEGDICKNCYKEFQEEEELKKDTNEQLNDLSTDCTLDESVDCIEKISDNSDTENNSTSITEYKEIEEPCVALTIIGENRLTDAEIFIKRGIKYSIKAFFSAIVLTIMNLFI